jgi:hypothetical protein
MVYGLAVVALGYAPTMRPVGQQRSAVQMQEAAGQPDAISTTGGYVEAPTALKDELGAIGPLGYWDPLGMVCSPTRQSPCVLPRCVMNAAALHALSRWSLALPATPYRPLPLLCCLVPQPPRLTCGRARRGLTSSSAGGQLRSSTAVSR